MQHRRLPTLMEVMEPGIQMTKTNPIRTVELLRNAQRFAIARPVQRDGDGKNCK